MNIAEAIAMAAGSSFLAGVRLHAVVAALGLAGRMGYVTLPGAMGALADPWVIGVAAGLAFVEFLADKIALVDTVWDAGSTFLRVPGGATLAAMALADGGPAATTIAALLGGTFAFGVHSGKTAARVAVNHSPEPFSNVAVSLFEDVGGLGAIALLLLAPLILLALLLLLVVWMGRKVGRHLKGRAKP